MGNWDSMQTSLPSDNKCKNSSPKKFLKDTKIKFCLFQLVLITSKSAFVLCFPSTWTHSEKDAALPESDAGSGVIKPASSFVIQNRQTSCSMGCPMYGARC